MKERKQEKRKKRRKKENKIKPKQKKEIKQTPSKMVTVPGTANPLSDSHKKTKQNKKKTKNDRPCSGKGNW